MASAQFGYQAPQGGSAGGRPRGGHAASAGSSEEVAILRDERTHLEDGTYAFAFEGANGIRVEGAGAPRGVGGSSEEAVVGAGAFSYTAPDGTPIQLQWVADEGGFQPQGAHLPVAPAFPHPIPQVSPRMRNGRFI